MCGKEDRFGGFVADGARRDVDDAEEGGGVGRVLDELKVAEHVLDSALVDQSSLTAGKEETTDSGRSKNLCPPDILDGIPAFCKATSMFLDSAPYLSRIAQSPKSICPPVCAMRCLICAAMYAASSYALGAQWRTTEEPEVWVALRDLSMRFVSA